MHSSSTTGKDPESTVGTYIGVGVGVLIYMYMVGLWEGSHTAKKLAQPDCRDPHRCACRVVQHSR